MKKSEEEKEGEEEEWVRMEGRREEEQLFGDTFYC